MSNKITIKPGDPQPVECPNCEDKLDNLTSNYWNRVIKEEVTKLEPELVAFTD